MSKAIRLFIADSNYLLRQGLKSVFSDQDSVEIVGEAATNEELYSRLKTSMASALLVDYDSGDFSEKSVSIAMDTVPELKVIGITPQCHVNVIRRLMDKGIHGHLLKDCDRQEVLDSVLRTAQGERFYCGQVLDQVNASEGIETEHGCDPVSLSTREIEILQYVAQGMTTKEIAEKLCLSFHTVMTHRKNMMNKLGTGNTAGLIIYAVRENLISPNKFLFSSDSGK